MKKVGRLLVFSCVSFSQRTDPRRDVNWSTKWTEGSALCGLEHFECFFISRTMSVITPCCTRAVVSLGRSVARDSGVSLLFVFFFKKNVKGHLAGPTP